MESTNKKKPSNKDKDKPKSLLQPSNPSKSKSQPAPALFSALNCNSNIFSQLSSMYSQTQSQPQQETKTVASDYSSLFATNFDHEIQRILHSLSKRSEITKLKALIELQEVLKTRDESFLESFLPSWTYLYKQIVTCEYDKKLLEEANQILAIYVNQAKNCLKGQFKELFPYWFLSMNDPNSEVASIAQKSFDSLFPPEKRSQVIVVCAEGFLANMAFFLKLDLQQILSENNALNESQAFEILDRLTVSLCNSLSESLSWIKGSPKTTEYIQMFCKTLELDKETVGLIKILEILENKKRGLRSRAAVLDLIAEIYMNLDPEKDFSNQAFHITKAVFTLIDDKERILQQALWRKALVNILKKTSEDMWKKICEGKHREVLINRIMDCLKRAGQGIGAVFYENLTIFLSLLPFAKLKNEKSEEIFKWKMGFIKGYMEAIWQGINHEEVKFFSESLISCYYECLYFLTLKRFVDIPLLGLSEAVMKFTKKILKAFIKSPLIDFLKNYNSLQAMNVYRSIPKRLAEFYENISSAINKQGDFFDESLGEYFSEVIESQKLLKNLNCSENYCKLLKELLSVLKSPYKGLKDLIESFLRESYRESLENVKEDFSGKLDDNTLMKVLGNMKFYLLVVTEIKVSITEFSKELIVDLKIHETFLILSKMLEKIIESLATIYKMSNFEKMSSIFSKILRLWLEIAQTIGIFSNQDSNEKTQDFLQFFIKQLQTKLTEFDSLPQLQSQNFLILITFILDPTTPESLFTDFQSLSQSPHQQDSLIWRILESIKPRNSAAFVLIKNSLEFQDLIVNYIEGFYRMKTFGLGAVEIPCVLGLLRDCLENERLNKMVLKSSLVCGEVLAKNKVESFEKLKNIYMVWSFLLVDANFNEGVKAAIIEKLYRIFFKTIGKAYHMKNNKDLLDHFYDFIGILEKKTTVFKEIFMLAFDEFSILIQETLKKGDLLDKTIEALCDFLDFLKSHHKSNEILTFFNEILLRPIMFKDALASRNIWLILKGCLEIVMDYKSMEEIFNYNDLFVKEIWLISLLLSAPNTYALFKDLPLKKFYQEALRPELINFVIKIVQNSSEINNYERFFLILDQIIKDSEEKSLIFLNGLRLFLKNVTLVASSDFIEKDLLPILSKYLINSLNLENLKLEDTDIFLRKSLISKTILIQLKGGLIFAGLIEDILQKLTPILNNPQKESSEELQFLIYLDFLLTIQPYQLQEGPFLQEELTTQIICFFFERFNEEKLKNLKEISRNFVYGTLFEYMNLITEQKTFVVFSDNIPAIEALIRGCIAFNMIPERYYTRSLISCNNFLRKILGFLEAFSLNFKGFILKELLGFFVKRLNGLKEEINEEVMIDESNDQIVMEFGETVSRFTIILCKEIEEIVLFELLITPFPAIQKSAFSLLKLHYQTIKPISFVVEEEENSINLKNFLRIFPAKATEFLIKTSPLIQQWNDEYLINPTTYSYLLIWVSMLLKITTTVTSSADLEAMKRLLKEYLEKQPIIYHEFLNNCFKGLKAFDPQLTGFGNKGNFITLDLMKIEVEWSEFLSGDSLMRLIVQALYLFSLSFPSFLRVWAETADKRYLKTADFYLKNYISPALFLSEIETIEMRQQDWKCEEFNIYVAKNTREINAIFTKESSQLEISLKIPYDYPLREINISCEKEVKLQEAKINKWIMRMRSLLRTENNSILNLLVLWKQNLEKEFEGLEECPICYYVIHSSTKEIPKLACKTCSHKFHSSCIHRWFNSSNKSECPLCKSQFL